MVLRTLTGRLTAWLVLAVALLAGGSIIAGAGAVTTSNDPTAALPPDAESTRVAAWQRQLPSGQSNPALVVYSRGGQPLTDAVKKIEADTAAFAALPRTPAEATTDPSAAPDEGTAGKSAVPTPGNSGRPATPTPGNSGPTATPTPGSSGLPPTPTPGNPGPPATPGGGAAGPPVFSPGRTAALVAVPLRADAPADELIAAVGRLREIARTGLPAGMTAQVTGGAGFGADIADSFTGANTSLLLVTVVVVALLLLITYRSPVLWLVPLAVVGLADRVASGLVAVLSRHSDLT
ncbi:MAG: MMPL family transporter, partial [Actinoplanes sp.]